MKCVILGLIVEGVIMGFVFASESVTEGHPDKMCDQLSDALLDAFLKEDAASRVAVECFAGNGLIVVGGEVTTETYVDVQNVVRDKILEIGFDDSVKGFDGNTCGVVVALSPQSSEIAAGVDESLEVRSGGADKGLGAGDQGLMFGFATRENPFFMPTAITLAHVLTERLSVLRKQAEQFSWLFPDGKAQVVVGYNDAGFPVSVEHVLVSTQHSASVGLDFVQKEVAEHVVGDVLREYNIMLEKSGFDPLDVSHVDVLVNPAGSWTVGGPKADAGLTGRKIIVDTYGGFARHGGGNFHGKDPSKVDRSAAYALRHVAKNLVAAGLVDKVELQVCYAIGKAEPLGLMVDSFGTAKHGVTDKMLEHMVCESVNLTPSGIINSLGLTGIHDYQKVAAYGHFGFNGEKHGMPWESLNLVERFRFAMNNV
jgi:S-adenosylmethionine synthetase